MKFKKIEISAFRVFNNPENALFDFTTKSGNTADFVSLYAPNGFGKTSFYDAVEWGVTGSVNRFFIRHKELAKLENNQSSKNEIPLLRNSKLERDTYVKVFSNSNENPIEKLISKDSILPDLPLKTNAVSHEFQKVILSQEWISAFLTEKDGEERYKKFMEIPELSGVNNYYINLKHLLSVQQLEENQLRQDIGRLHEKVKDIEDNNLLETINYQINKLISVYGEDNLPFVNFETTDKELIEFKGLIAKKIIHFNNQRDSLVKKIDQLRIAKIGNEDLLSIKSFSENKILLPKIVHEIKDVEQLINKFEEHKELTNQLNKHQLTLKELSSKREILEPVLAKFNQYETVKIDIINKVNSQAELDKELQELIKIIEELKREEISAHEQLKTCLQQIETNEGKKRLLPLLQKSIEDTDKALIEIDKSILELNPNKESLENKIKVLQNQITDYSSSINKIQEAKYSIKDFKEQSVLIELVSELENIHHSIQLERDRINVLNNKIEHQQDLNSTIQDFIKQGLAIVNESQTHSCPLCEQPYSDFSALASKISGNKAFSLALQELLNQKQELIKILNSLEEKVSSGNKKLVDFYNVKINSAKTEVALKTKIIESVETRIKESSEQQESLKLKRAEIVTSMTGMSFAAYESHLNNLTGGYLASKIKYSRGLVNCQASLKEKNEQGEKIKSQLLLLNQETSALSTNADYLAVKAYFNENHPSEAVSKIILDNSLEYLKQKNINIKEDVERLKNLLNPLDIKLSKYKEGNLKSQKSELERKRASLEKNVDKYSLFLKENFEINSEVFDIIEIAKLLENKDSESKQELDKSTSKHDEYVTLEKNSEHIIDFLQTEKAKIKIKAKEEKLSFLKTIVRTQIEKERKVAKEYLEERIKDFFFEDLINKLYEKIDPHPDYKKVNFIPNLDLEIPRLDVFVKNGNSETLIPNLYFSTAQINILSLCIFLASALKSKEYDCIFIDDPIQSMDSINVLSTIDLLRSIVVNNGKQIIISTHDENFHKLLKKKIPTDLFQSKFLKLESFGKVINDV